MMSCPDCCILCNGIFQIFTFFKKIRCIPTLLQAFLYFFCRRYIRKPVTAMQAEHPQIFYISDRNSTNMVVFPQDRLKKEDKVRLFLSRSFLSGLVFLIFLIIYRILFLIYTNLIFLVIAAYPSILYLYCHNCLSQTNDTHLFAVFHSRISTMNGIIILQLRYYF